MPRPTTAQATRRATNVTLPADLLDQARALGLNVSQACETGLKAESHPVSRGTVAGAEPRRAGLLQRSRGAQRPAAGGIPPGLKGRYNVYATPGRGGIGYVLDVKADLLQSLSIRAVVPLLPPNAAPNPARGLNPVFHIDGQPHLMLTQFIAAVPAKALLTPVLSLDPRNDDIMRALDLLLIGF